MHCVDGILMNHGPDSDQPKPLAQGTVPADVPVFNCIVYVHPTPNGVHLRVANLAGIECEANNEREGLAKIVRQFKEQTSRLLSENETIHWSDPIPEPRSDEQTRFIPVHL